MNMFLIQLLIPSNIHRLGRLSMIKIVKEQAIRNPETFRWDLFNIFPAPLGKTQGLSSLFVPFDWVPRLQERGTIAQRCQMLEHCSGLLMMHSNQGTNWIYPPRKSPLSWCLQYNLTKCAWSQFDNVTKWRVSIWVNLLVQSRDWWINEWTALRQKIASPKHPGTETAGATCFNQVFLARYVNSASAWNQDSSNGKPPWNNSTFDQNHPTHSGCFPKSWPKSLFIAENIPKIWNWFCLVVSSPHLK